MTLDSFGHHSDLLSDFCGKAEQVHELRDSSPAESILSGEFGPVAHRALPEECQPNMRRRLLQNKSSSLGKHSDVHGVTPAAKHLVKSS